MFFSSFSCFFVCHFVQTHIFATKVLLFSHICKRETYFFKKKSYFTSFSSPIPFVLPLYATYLPSTLFLKTIDLIYYPPPNITCLYTLHFTLFTIHFTPEKTPSKAIFLAHIKKKYYFCGEIRNIKLTPFATCLHPSSYSAPSCYCSALLCYG